MPYSLSVKKRAGGESISDLLKKNIVPGVIYGPEVKENILIQISEQDLKKAYDLASSAMIDLVVGDQKTPLEVLLKAVQFDSISDRPVHVDFYQVKRGQKIETEVDLHFIGEAPAVKTLGGILVKQLDSISVKCLPRDLEKVADLQVDLSQLNTFEDYIHIKDIKIPDGVELMENLDDVVAFVSEPEEDIAEAAPSLEDQMQKVEVEAKGKEVKEGEAEGKAAPAEKSK
ncbi:MAG: 50S ribosomal protein L25 [Patescibacteria group bacterium]